MRLLLLASLGGAIGAGARYLVNVACAAWLSLDFPWPTFFVNVLGGFLMGVVVGGLVPALDDSPAWRVFLATGVLGGFTTFSAFSLEIYNLMDRQANGLALVYVLASVVLSVLALVAGLASARWSFR
jgi:CrcB protein